VAAANLWDGDRSMSVSKAETFKKRVFNAPEWGAEEFAPAIDAILISIDNRLEEMEIEWIMAQFSGMNDKMRNEILRRMLEMMKTSSSTDCGEL
ncbi:MAG: hypothetical protein IJS50_01700, partial [Desulfovibrio sp.]|nr:hypothetical protein [Desulfovibrio sp.]